MEKLIVNDSTEKRYLFSEILKMQRDGIISNSDTLKALRYASKLRNKYNKHCIERASYDKDDINMIDTRNITKLACSVIARS
jgi:hypothetical protein